MNNVPTPLLEHPVAVDASSVGASLDVPIDDAPAPNSDRPVVTVLPDDPRSPTAPPSPTPSHHSSASTLTPLSSPIRPPASRDPSLERDELLEPSPQGTPPPSTSVSAIPADSPLASRARLVDSRSGSRLDTETEWRTFEPNWRLQLVSRDSNEGGHTVYPPVACSTCTEAETVCSGVNGVKCARCKARHSVCSLYVSPFPSTASYSLFFLTWPYSKTTSRVGLEPERSSLGVKSLRVSLQPRFPLSSNPARRASLDPRNAFDSFLLRPLTPQLRTTPLLLQPPASLRPLARRPRLMTQLLPSLWPFEAPC